jgi:hypothetical protein
LTRKIEYQIIEADGFSELERRVQNQISFGWRPLGGVAVDSAKYRTVAQAMIRTPADDDTPYADD